MKFINKATKVVLNADSDFTIEQLKKNPDYEEVKAKAEPKEIEIKKEVKQDKKSND